MALSLSFKVRAESSANEIVISHLHPVTDTLQCFRQLLVTTYKPGREWSSAPYSVPVKVPVVHIHYIHTKQNLSYGVTTVHTIYPALVSKRVYHLSYSRDE